MFDRSAAPGLSAHEAVIDVLARTGHGLRIREIARILEVNASTASRRIRDLRNQGWVVTTTELQGLPVAEDERDLHMTLNPNRPGLKEYLDWMHVEYGTDRRAFWQFVKQLRSHGSVYPPHTPPLNKLEPTEEPVSVTVRSLLHSVGGAPISAPHYRALTGRVVEVNRWPGRTASFLHPLYKTQAGASERYRDFIHMMGHISDDLRGFPPPADEKDARPELAELAIVAHHNALVFSKYAQRVFEAAILGRHRDHNLALLADWARNELLPGAEPRSYISGGEELLAAERLRHIYTQLDSGDRDGWKYYRHGGTPGRDDVGGAGDGLLAQMMLHQAHQAQEIADEIAAMPGMSDVLAVPEVAVQLEREVPHELTTPKVAGEDLQVRLIPFSRRAHHDEKVGDAALEELTISGRELRIGDRILAVDNHKMIDPLEVDTLSESGTVDLAKGIYAISVTMVGFLDNKAVTVSRRTKT